MKRRIIIISKLILRHFEKNPNQGFVFFCGVAIAIVSGSIIIALFAGVGLYEAILNLIR